MNEHLTIHCPIQSSIETFSNELEPLLLHLRSNVFVTQPITFPRGTVLPDGRLDLCKQSLGIAGCQAVTSALTENTTIVSLLMGTNGIGDNGAVSVAQLIERNQHLEIIYLGCNAIAPPGVATITQALTNNSSVTGLWLKRNHIGESGAHHIAQMLRHNRSIRTLDLVNTQIGYEGLKAILEVLISHNRTIERLYLGGNQICVKGALLLATLLSVNPAIKSLLLNVNYIGDAGAVILADALRDNQTLQELGIASNGVGCAGGITLIEAIQVHPALTHLDLGYSPSTIVLGAQSNCIGDVGARAIANLLAQNQTLLQVNLRCNNITGHGKAYLVAGLQQNARLQQLVLDGKQDKQIVALLERNRILNANNQMSKPRDVELIRSVYRKI